MTEKYRAPWELLSEEPDLGWGAWRTWRARKQLRLKTKDKEFQGKRDREVGVMLGLQETSMWRIWVLVMGEIRSHCGISSRGMIGLILSLNISLWLQFWSGLEIEHWGLRNQPRACHSDQERNGRAFWIKMMMLEKVKSEWSCLVGFLLCLRSLLFFPLF